MKALIYQVLLPFSLLCTQALATDSTQGPADGLRQLPQSASPAPDGQLEEKFTPAELHYYLQGRAPFSQGCYGLASYNFGVLVDNEYYQIYRSRALGSEGVYRLFEHMDQHKLVRPSQVIFMNKDGYRKPVGSGILSYLERHMPYMHTLNNFAYQEALLFNKHGVFPEVSFYHPLNAPVYLYGYNPLHDRQISETHSFTDEETRRFLLAADPHNELRQAVVSSKENLYHILGLLLGRQGASLFHCTGGLHRTGMVALAIRHLQGGMWTEPFAQPLHVEQNGGLVFDELVINNLAEAEYVLHNRNQGRQANLEAIRELATEERFHTLQATYQEYLNAPSRCR